MPRSSSELGTEGRQGNRSLIHCPDCGKPTYTHVRYGDIAIWCRHCEKLFEVLIKGGIQEDKAGSKQARPETGPEATSQRPA